jgi:hypothetical protein
MIDTDGFACSIIFSKVKNPFEPPQDDLYIESVCRKKLIEKRLVSVDPGVNSPLTFISRRPEKRKKNRESEESDQKEEYKESEESEEREESGESEERKESEESEKSEERKKSEKIDFFDEIEQKYFSLKRTIYPEQRDDCRLIEESEESEEGEESEEEKNSSAKANRKRENYTTFRYTMKQRIHETKRLIYEKRRDDEKSNTRFYGRTVKQWEATLSSHDSKTLNRNSFMQYLIAKNEVNKVLLDFYAKDLFRKLKWYAYINKQRSEAKLIKGFKQKFGGPDEVFVGFGDWEAAAHMRFKHPVKGKGYRTLFKRAGYNICLVDEFKTSSYCSNCQNGDQDSKMSNARDEDGNSIHSLLICKKCRILWNRDINGAINILKCLEMKKAGKKRPKFLRRQSSP